MRCQLAALCDAANTTGDGKINILGEFDTIFARSVPAAYPLMVFIAKIKAGQGDLGEHSIQLRVINEDMDLITSIQGRFRIDHLGLPGLEAGAPLLMQIASSQFPDYGTYTFQLVVDGVSLCDLPLHIVRPGK